MKLKTRRVLVGVALLGVLAQAPVAAEDYPSRPITIVVSLAAGSGMDTITRLYADKLSEALGKPVIVENKPGAATTLAANQVANARPDGHMLVVLTAIAMSINPTLFKHLNYEPQDLTPVSLYAKSPSYWSLTLRCRRRPFPSSSQWPKQRTRR
jgi:tripartite-type tricarboxylate transporter receptor subunit TctC